MNISRTQLKEININMIRLLLINLKARCKILSVPYIRKIKNQMKRNKTFIPLVILLATFVVTGDANNFVFASPDYDRMNVELSQSSKVIKKHTVQDNENLTVIGKKYNTSVTRIADLNKLINPNLVIRGQELKVEFLENKSIRVGPTISKPVNFPQGRKVIEHVIYPDKNDFLAPANPVVTYEIVEADFPRPDESLGQSKTFKSWMSFIKWSAWNNLILATT
jgi:LysM repeat protein